VAAGQANSNRQGLNKDALRGMQSALDDETAHADTFLCCRPLKDEHPLVVSGLRSVGLLRRQVTSGAWFSLFPLLRWFVAWIIERFALWQTR